MTTATALGLLIVLASALIALRFAIPAYRAQRAFWQRVVGSDQPAPQPAPQPETARTEASA